MSPEKPADNINLEQEKNVKLNQVTSFLLKSEEQTV